MRARFFVALVLNAAVAAAMIVVGVEYMAASEMMPHHLQVLGTPFSSLPPNCQLLLLTLMKGTGLAGVVAGVSLAVLLAVPFRRREPWSRYALLLAGGVALVPMLVGAIRLRIQTGASIPWWPHVALLAALGVAFWLSRGSARADGK